MLKKISNALLYIVLPILLTTADLVIKNLFYRNQEIHKEVLLFSLSLTRNYGIMTGIPFNFSEIVIIFTLVALFAAILKNKSFDLLIYFFVALLGIISNLIDRLRFGFVVDYINILNISHFNIADLLIYIGGALMVWKLIGKPTKKQSITL